MQPNVEKQGEQRSDIPKKAGGGGAPWLWVILAGCLGVVLLGLLLPRHEKQESRRFGESNAPAQATGIPRARVEHRLQPRHYASTEPGLTAEQTVANKVSQFARKRRDLARAIVQRLGLKLSPEVERFFDLAEAGRWEELQTLFASLKENRERVGSPEAVKALWGPLMETYGVEQIAHSWPAQNLLDYGEAVLSSLRPGMVYVGGTDPGRFIPTLLNETSDGEPHIVLTQNALADGSYLDYARSLYGDRMAALSDEDSQRAFQDYVADAQKRLAHDEQFPDEPRQIRPGEDVRTVDGRVLVSGEVAVMAINEKLLQALMDKNPDLSFALEESFPLKSTYASAAPLGPIMELRLPDEQQPLTSTTAAASLSYWRSTATQLLAGSDGSDSDLYVLKTYSKMAAAQANLLADHQLTAEAEQAYAVAMQIYPGNPEAVFSYVNLLLSKQEFADAIQVAQNAVNAAPGNQQFLALLQQLKQRGN